MRPVIYEIDRRDDLRLLEGAWAAEAATNGASHLASGLEGRSIWEFIHGETTRQVYESLTRRARSGHWIAFHYRCDSPLRRRYMRMRMGPAGDEGVRFESTSVSARTWPVEPQSFHNENAAMLRVCSWCLRVLVDDVWQEPETAVDRFGMFIGEGEPFITHGICARCTKVVEQTLAGL